MCIRDSLYLSYGNSQDKIRIFTLLCSAGALGLAAGTVYVGNSVERIVAMYAVYCSGCVAFGMALMLQMFKAASDPSAAVKVAGALDSAK